MLTLKTTMLGRLKEAYDSDMHKLRWLNAYCVEEARAKHNDCAPNHLGYYQGLRNISQALGATIIMAFGTAILQMTLGFVTHPVAIGICAGAATGTVGLLIFLCVQMLLAHVEWFDILEADKRDKILAESREHEEKMTQHSETPASPTGSAQSVGKPKTSTKAPKGQAPQKPSSE